MPGEITRRRQKAIKRRRRSYVLPRDRFTKRTRFVLYKALRARCSITTACNYANISESTFREWLEIGAQPLQSNSTSPRYNTPYCTFYRIVKQIEKEHEENALKCIQLAQDGGQKVKETKIKIGGKFGTEVTKITKELNSQWQAAAWYLERTRPKEYNPAVMAKVGGGESAQELAQSVWEAVRAMDTTIPECEEEEA